ncbi:hypothetical protein T09_9592 [Trichinella sp. T9]|nr:hypothetical protein T09_9592 [Trichinella sp. T9]
MLLESETFPGISCFISFPVIPTKIATSRNFLTISHQISIYESCDQGSSPSETPLILIDDS